MRDSYRVIRGCDVVVIGIGDGGRRCDSDMCGNDRGCNSERGV